MSRNKTPNFIKAKDKALQALPTIIGDESVKFFKDCFSKEGFTDGAFQPWQKRKSPLGGKKILIGKDNTMNLMQSIAILEKTDKRVAVGSHLNYAQIHNNGGVIRVTAKMKKFWWAKYYEFSGKVNKRKDGNVRQGARNQMLNAKAEFCKHMALMKEGAVIKIPKRQFIGESRIMFANIQSVFNDYLQEQIRNNV